MSKMKRLEMSETRGMNVTCRPLARSVNFIQKISAPKTRFPLFSHSRELNLFPRIRCAGVHDPGFRPFFEDKRYTIMDQSQEIILHLYQPVSPSLVSRARSLTSYVEG